MTNLDSILKSRDITLPTKVCLVKAMVFPVVMYGCESWTIKKAEHRKINAFKLWCWRRLLRVPWTARRSKIGRASCRERVEAVADFLFFLDSKITADGNCSLEIKRCLLLERKPMTDLDSILKSRDITLPTKVRLVKAMVFPVVL